jgi:hypothetical protein
MFSIELVGCTGPKFRIVGGGVKTYHSPLRERQASQIG